MKVLYSQLCSLVDSNMFVSLTTLKRTMGALLRWILFGMVLKYSESLYSVSELAVKHNMHFAKLQNPCSLVLYVNFKGLLLIPGAFASERATLR